MENIDALNKKAKTLFNSRPSAVWRGRSPYLSLLQSDQSERQQLFGSADKGKSAPATLSGQSPQRRRPLEE